MTAIFETEKSRDISATPMQVALRILSAVQISNFRKSSMADGRHFENHYSLQNYFETTKHISISLC